MRRDLVSDFADESQRHILEALGCLSAHERDDLEGMKQLIEGLVRDGGGDGCLIALFVLCRDFAQRVAELERVDLTEIYRQTIAIAVEM